MNLQNNNHKINISQFARKHNISRDTARKIAKEFGATKTREQYLKDANTRRETAYKLRQQGLKYKEIGEKLGITTQNAQMLVRRYQHL